jgi:phospholipase/carboxylesterase
MREETLGGLACRITGGTDRDGGGDGPIVILLHGFGAPGDDLVSLWRVLDVPPSVRFVFPEAPEQLPWQFGGGRAWWMIDLEQLQRALAGGSRGDMSQHVPEGIDAARAQVVALLGDVERLGGGPLVLGGFSQGAMLSCDVALRTERPLAGLVLLSSTLLAEREWTPLMERRRGLPVLQSHGRQDPLLPFAAAERLRDHLTAAGLAVEWLEFNGGHEIPPSVLDRAGGFITRAVTREAP